MIPRVNKNFVQSFVNNATENLLHSMLPDDYEMYLIALEVRDDEAPAELSIKDFMIFPVNPESVLYINKTFSNVHKTMSGVHVIDNDSFVPRPMNLTGNFGRSFKMIFNGGWGNFSFKSGYGATKKLDAIVDLSKSISPVTGKPYRVVMYNLMFNQIYTIAIHDCKFSMTMGSNMIWNYDLNFTVVAPGDLSQYKTSKENVVLFDLINKATKEVFDYGKGLIG